MKKTVFIAVMLSILGSVCIAQDVTTARNTRLDATFKTFFGGNNASALVDSNLAETYRLYGTPMATVIIQHQIDYNIFLAFLNGDSRKLTEFPDNSANHSAAIAGDNTSIVGKKVPILQLMDSNFGEMYLPLFDKFSQKPSFDEILMAINNYVYSNEYKLFGGSFLSDFRSPFVACQQRLAGLGEDEKGSTLVACQIWLADMMYFRQLINSAGFDLKSKSNERLAQTFQAYMNTVEPKAE